MVTTLTHVLTGKIRNTEGKALARMIVRAYDHDPASPHDYLGEAATDASGTYLIRYSTEAFNVGGLEQGGPDLFIKVYDGDYHIGTSSPVNSAGTQTTIHMTVSYTPPEIRTSGVIEGRVLLGNGLPAKRLPVYLYRSQFGGTSSFVGEAKTDDQGRYKLPYDLPGKASGLEIRSQDAQGKSVALSKPLYALREEGSLTLDLVAPAAWQPIESEYRRMASDVTARLGSMSKLLLAKEDDSHHDLTLLNHESGWDARLLALAAVSERMNVEQNVNLPREPLYGLLRAGLPSDPIILAQVEPDAAELALKRVREAGIVSLTDAEIGAFKRQFASFAERIRLEAPIPGSSTSYGQLLEAAGLGAAEKTKFASVYLSHRGEESALWEKAREQGLSDAQIHKLQLQGKLAYLSGNSGPVTARLMQMELDHPAQLTDRGFYRADVWRDALRAWANQDAGGLEAMIPAAYGGADLDQRLEAYAEHLARKVRLSYPTHVVKRMIEQDEIPLGGNRESTAKLLGAAASQGYRLGQTPVKAFLQTHQGVAAELDETDKLAAQEQLMTLHRVYQMTPSNEGMPVLISLGVTSAYDLLEYSEELFAERYASKHEELFNRKPADTEPLLIYRKAQQIAGITYNLFAIAKKLENEPIIHGMSSAAEVRESVRNELVKQFPTMESLFGSMDFCECEHCQSVLSPAAYLVDLLQFIDPSPEVWGNFEAHWEARHDGKRYADQYLKPFDALAIRRPDLQHIPLTCENSQTAMPYIDLVNEILEYYAAHGTLTEEAAQDTGEATTAELLAEPQNVIQEAYKKLWEARYPLRLPFDLPLETVRRFGQHFGTPLAELMEAFRKPEELFAPDQPYDRYRIFVESLNISPEEEALFANPDPLASWHELYGFETAAEALTVAVDPGSGQRMDLNSAKALSRRLGVTYRELIDIVQTGFVNPRLASLAVLYKLGVGIHDVRFYLDHKPLLARNPDALTTDERQRRLEALAFQERIGKLAERFGIPASLIESELRSVPFARILVLADPEAGCDFDLTTLRYADGTPADGTALLRINLFVRLWRKLGWTIEETDAALAAFVPKQAPFEPAHWMKQPLKTALVYLAHLKTLDAKLSLGEQSRIKLTALWADLSTFGRTSLYARTFLTRSVLKSDPVFDDPLGRYLSTSEPLSPHLATLQGVTGLSADDVERILQDNGQSTSKAELTIATVSLLYRYGMFAKGLGLSIGELIALKRMSGLDPFRPLHAAPLAKLEEDYPFTQTVAFVEMAESVRASGFAIEELDDLLRNRTSAFGRDGSEDASRQALLKTLAEGIRAIRSEHAPPEAPGPLNEDALRQKLSLALPKEVVERFMAMLNGTVEYTASTNGVSEEHRLDPNRLQAFPRIAEVEYDAVRQRQTLVYRGVLLDADKAAVLAAVPSAVLSDLLDDVQRQAATFFKEHLEKQELAASATNGFLDAADYELLFEQVAGAGQHLEQERVLAKQRKLADAFIPFLQERLTRQYIVQTLAAHTTAPAELMEGLLTDGKLSGTAKPLADVFAGLGARGVSAAFFASFDGSGEPNWQGVLADANTGSSSRAEAAGSATMEGYVEVPANGTYRFYVVLDKQGAEAELRFDHLPNPVFVSGKADSDGHTLGGLPHEYLELKAGTLYRYTLKLTSLNGGEARLLAHGEQLSKGSFDRLALYPLESFEAAGLAEIALSKMWRVLQTLKLDTREARYLFASPDYRGIAIGELQSSDSADSPATLAVRFNRLMRLADYARLKRDWAGGSNALIDVFEANGAKDMPRVYGAIGRLARVDASTVQAAAEALFDTPDLSTEAALQRLRQLLSTAVRLGVPVDAAKRWTRIAGPGMSAEARFEIARDVKEAIKSRYDAESWQRIAQPIFDGLRQRQRDALVSYVMANNGFDREEQLYDYFLIDPGMEPVVQTSRIRLAISSVQLFIQRVLLNLEPDVHPSVINASQWEWMKRYRVWEANRKLFLFPENWLEPEFRDDKTHLYRELESDLMQDDVSSDLAEDAFLNYLRKLDGIARLDIVAAHLEDHPDPALRTLHVIGRTFSQPHNYFYRRFAHRMWTPWEPVGAEIESDHLAPVVWRNRLYLFWVTFADRPADQPDMSATSSAKMSDMTIDSVFSLTAHKQIDIRLHWSEYMNGEWSASESGGFSSVITAKVPIRFDPRSAYIHVSTEHEQGEERGVYIHLGGSVNRSFYLAGRNSVPEAAAYRANGERGEAPKQPYSAGQTRASKFAGSGALTVEFNQRITTESGKTEKFETTPSILRKGRKFTLLPVNNRLELGMSANSHDGADDPEAVRKEAEAGAGDIAALMKPLFYQDDLHTFFVEPEVAEKTIEEWQGWVTRTPLPEWNWHDAEWWKNVAVASYIPDKLPLPEPVMAGELLPEFAYRPDQTLDWLVNAGTGYVFDGVLLGPAGKAPLEIIHANSTPAELDAMVPVNVSAGSGLVGGSLVLTRSDALRAAGLQPMNGSLNVVGNSGFNLSLARNFAENNLAGRVSVLGGMIR